MDMIYICIGTTVMIVACYVEYLLTRYTLRYLYVLPLVFAALTFWIGLGSLLFGFALIFIGELVPNRHQRDSTDVF